MGDDYLTPSIDILYQVAWSSIRFERDQKRDCAKVAIESIRERCRYKTCK